MIIGLIPVGGKGVRLGLPYSKEMLPQKSYDFYNPVINHLVEKMELAGAEQIVFVHGLEYKEDIVNHFDDDSFGDFPKYVHIRQSSVGFANVISDFWNQVETHDGDKVIFGLPDSVFNVNPFVEMINEPGIVAGLFTTEPNTKVDRLRGELFEIKAPKTEFNSDWFWGVLKFDIENITKMVEDEIFDNVSEIGDILNYYGFKTINGDKYLDLGTWSGYNKYLTSDLVATNVEIEKKYDALAVSKEDFAKLYPHAKCLSIVSTDHYFTNNNKAIEFIRYREDSNDEGAIPDITVKNKSGLNRFELTVPLSKEATAHNVTHLMSLLNTEFKFKVTKDCLIYTFEDYSIVYYTFEAKDQEFAVIEVELNKSDFNLIAEVEQYITKSLPGFDASKVINKSKFKMVQEVYDSTH